MRVYVVAVGLVLLPSAAAAQIRFEWPAPVIDIAQYATVEQCLAATARVADSVRNRGAVHPDTLLYGGVAEALRPPPAPVVETARRCSARFPAAPAPVEDLAPLLTLYLEAGRDADASMLVTRRLATIAPAAEHERAAALDTITRAYLAAQPARLDAAQAHLTELGRLGAASPWQIRMNAFGNFSGGAWSAGDTVRAEWAAKEIVAMAKTLTDAERRTTSFNWLGKHMVYGALILLDHRALLDSLRRSTAGYVAAKRASWARASGERPDALRFPIGEQAPALAGDFWFQRGDSAGGRPTKGVTSLVVFLEQACPNTSRGCQTTYAALRRLAERFPELQITLVSQTQGYFQGLPPLTPSEEADALRRWWLEFHRLPVALVVATREFWRLPDPDRRRINRDVPNTTNYSFGRSWVAGNESVFLVDPSGTIVEVGSLIAPSNEPHFAELIEILRRRQMAAF